LIYDIRKTPFSTIICSYESYALPNPFEVDSLKDAVFEGYSLVNETFAAIISNVQYTDYDTKFTVAIDAYSEAPASVEQITAEGNSILTTITKYIEGEQPENVFEPPTGLVCKKFAGLNKMRRNRRLLF
jgi:hypothetical protein